MLLPAGCKHQRYSAFSTVEGEVRKITTRNRYTLVGVKHAAQNVNADVTQGNLQQQQFSNGNLKRFQPGVFADDGIRFMVREVWLLGRDSYESPFGWTAFLMYPTFCVLPGWGTKRLDYRVTVDVLDNPDARAVFELHGRSDISFSLTPLPILFYMGDASPQNELGERSAITCHGFDSVFGSTNTGILNDCKTEMEAFAIAATLKKMEDDGLIDESRVKSKMENATTSAAVDGKFEIVDFRKDGDCAHRYAFTLRLRSGSSISLRESRNLQKMLRSMVREDYQASFPDVAAGSLVVDFPEFSLCGNAVAGRAAVLSLAVESLRYDHHAHLGTMRLRIGENQFEDARRYARRNIESLVRDKNVALDARAIPPAATFYIRDEKLKGDVLEVVFKAE